VAFARDVRSALVVALSVSLAAIVCACGATPAPDDEAPIPQPPYESFEERPCPPDSALTWENFGDPFMRNWCTACHSGSLVGDSRGGAPLGLDFDDLDRVRAAGRRAPRRRARAAR
jgi:cytochrome c5